MDANRVLLRGQYLPVKWWSKIVQDVQKMISIRMAGRICISL